MQAPKEERARIVETVGACALCLSWSHIRDQCMQTKRACGIKGFTSIHNRLVHGTSVAFVNATTQEVNDPDDEEVPPLLRVTAVYFPSHDITLPTLLDTASDFSLITNRAAERLGLIGAKCTSFISGASLPEPSTNVIIKSLYLAQRMLCSLGHIPFYLQTRWICSTPATWCTPSTRRSSPLTPTRRKTEAMWICPPLAFGD